MARVPGVDAGQMGDTALSPVEEALVSPVLVMTSVLMLPKGGQLGYRGGVINFVNDVVKIATTLPSMRVGSGCSQY